MKRLMFVALILLPALASQVVADDEKTVEALRSAADSLMSSKQHDEARRLYRMALDRYPKSKHGIDLVNKLCSTYTSASSSSNQGLNARDEVIACLQRLVTKHPKTFAAYHANRIVGRTISFGWRFGELPERLQTDGQKAIKIKIHDELWQRKFKPKYTLYQIPPGEYRQIVERAKIDGDSLADIHNRIARSKWHIVKTRASINDPKSKTTRLQRDTQRWPGRPYDLLHADLSTGGIYVLEQQYEGFKTSNVIRVESFGIACRALAGRAMVYAVNPWSGEPVANVKIRLRMKDKTVKGRTGKNGLLFVDLPSPAIVTATLENETHACFLKAQSTPDERARVYVTTDRPIYRPDQTVHFKAVRRNLAGSRLRHPKKRDVVSVEIRDPEGRSLHEQQCRWNEFGTLSGSFHLPSEPRLGQYEVVVHVENPWSDTEEWQLEDQPWRKFWRKTFKVAEYRKPELQVTVAPLGTEAEADGNTRAKISAEYYFGGPAANAEVEWTVVALVDEDDVPSFWQTEPFEDPRSWFYKPRAERLDEDESADEYDFGTLSFFENDVVARGTGQTGPDGSLEISVKTTVGNGTGKYLVHATVRDLSRLTASGSATIEHVPSLVVHLGTDRLFYEPGELIPIRIHVVTTDGKPARQRDVRLIGFLANEIVSDDSAEFESFYSKTVRTDGQGRATAQLKSPKDGQLRLRASILDQNQRRSEDRCDLWIAGDAAVEMDRDFMGSDLQFDGGMGGGFGLGVVGMRGPFAASEQRELRVDAIPDRLAYAPGEKIRLMVRTNDAPLTVLVNIEGRGFQETRIVRLKEKCEIVELPVRETYTPTIRVMLCGWKDGDFAGYGMDLFTYPANKLLNVNVSTNKKQFAPREKAKVTIDVRTFNGVPAAAEVELGIVDKSLFSLQRDRTPDMRLFFFPESDDPLTLGATIPCFWNGHWPYGNEYSIENRFSGSRFLYRETQQPFVTSVIGSGFDVRSVALANAAPTETRSRFADTFFWSAHVKTGRDGKAVLEIDVPDNLTSWRIVARAVSGADRFGTSQSSVITRKDVILRLATPRFYTERDEAVVSTIVRSELNEETEFLVRLKCDGAEAGGERTIIVGPHSERRVDWPIKVTRAGTIKLHAESLSRSASDAVQIELPVRAYGLTSSSAQSGIAHPVWKSQITLPKDAARETASLELVVGTPMRSGIRDALPYLAKYPYGCVEQTMSRFLPALVAVDAMKRLQIANPKLEEEIPKMVESGLQRLYGFQHDDGGWGWWKHDATDDFMTAYVVYGLLTAREVGYRIDPETLKRGLAAVRNRNVTAFSLYVRKLAGDDVTKPLKRVKLKKGKGKGDDTVLHLLIDEPFGNDPFGTTGAAPSERRATSRLVGNAKEYRAGTVELAYYVLAGRRDLAKHLPAKPPQNAGPKTVGAAALVLRAIASVEQTDKRIGPLVDWIMLQRRGGAWYSTLDTALVVMTFSQIARSVDEPDVEVQINGQKVVLKDGRVKLDGSHLRRGKNQIQVRCGSNEPVHASALLRFFATDLQKAAKNQTVTMRVERYVERAILNGKEKKWKRLESGDVVVVADELRVLVNVAAPDGAERVMIESPIAAGTETRAEETGEYDRWDFWYDRRELRDDRVSVAVGLLDATKRKFEYRLRPTLPGVYQILPTVAFEMYDPDKRGFSKPFVLRVVDQKE